MLLQVIHRSKEGISKSMQRVSVTRGGMFTMPLFDGESLVFQCYDEGEISFEGFPPQTKQTMEARIKELEDALGVAYEAAGEALNMPTEECDHDY